MATITALIMDIVERLPESDKVYLYYLIINLYR